MSWPTLELGDLVDAKTGFASGENVPDGIVQIRMNNITSDGALDWSKIRRVPLPKKGVSDLLAESGDILFNATNSPDLVGKSAYFSDFGEPVTFSNHFLRLRPKPSLSGLYLAHWLQVQWRAGVFKGLCRAWVNQASVSREHLLALRVPLPPLDEQRRIAAILDQADALRRKRREAIALLEKLPPAIFSRRFGSCLENPNKFPSCRMVDIIEFAGGTQPPKSNFLYEDGPDRVRFVQTRDFRTDQYKTYLPKHLAKRPFTEDDVIVGRYGPPVFQIFRGLSGTYNVALMKAAPKKGLSNDFVFYLLKEEKLQAYVSANSIRTAGQSGVNLDLLDNCPAYMPPLDAQAQFSEEVRLIERSIAAQKIQASTLDALFASLLHRAFRGEL